MLRFIYNNTTCFLGISQLTVPCIEEDQILEFSGTIIMLRRLELMKEVGVNKLNRTLKLNKLDGFFF